MGGSSSSKVTPLVNSEYYKKCKAVNEEIDTKKLVDSYSHYYQDYLNKMKDMLSKHQEYEDVVNGKNLNNRNEVINRLYIALEFDFSPIARMKILNEICKLGKLHPDYSVGVQSTNLLRLTNVLISCSYTGR